MFQPKSLYAMFGMALLSGVLFALPRFAFADDDAIRYEVAIETSVVSEEHRNDDYVVAGEPSPGVRAKRERDYHDFSGHFSFFFTPILEDATIPIALRRFYAHSSALHFSGTIEPEHTATYAFYNPAINYRASSEDDERLRQAGVDGTFYVLRHSGLRLHTMSAKDEQVSFETSPALDNQSRAETNEIRRYYGAGLTQYVSDNFAVTLDYTRHDYELRSLEKVWQNALTFDEVGRDTDTKGHALSFSGEYVWQKHVGFRLAYNSFFYKSDSDVQTVHLQNFAGDTSTFDDDGAQQTLTPTLSLYLGEKFMAQIGAGMTWTAITRTYDKTNDVEYDWTWKQAQGGVSYYFTRHLGAQANYMYRTRDGEVNMRHEGNTRSTFQVESDVQDIQVGVTGRF